MVTTMSEQYENLVVDVSLVLGDIRFKMEKIAHSKSLGAEDVARIQELSWVHDKLDAVL